MEDDSKISLITKRIDEAPFGSAFVTSDFTDLAEYETAKKTISRLEKKGTLRRVLRGVYDKPKFSSLLQEYAAPIPDQIAHAIARNYNWTISASGNTALNQLGLSTQVPADWSYISSGPYKKYTFGNITLTFSHRSNSQMIGTSDPGVKGDRPGECQRCRDKADQEKAFFRRMSEHPLRIPSYDQLDL